MVLVTFALACATAQARPPAAPLALMPLFGGELPRRAVIDVALRAYRCGRAQGYFSRPLVTVIDYSLPSTAKRLWVIDVERRRVLFNERVAHGANSGDAYAHAFSNRLGSRQSSLGVFRTHDTYEGRHGLALRLAGLEPGINDNAHARAIVMHGAPYLSAEHIARWGQAGRSWGCPAIPEGAHERVIERIRGGSAVVAYYPDEDWLRGSRFLNCHRRATAEIPGPPRS